MKKVSIKIKGGNVSADFSGFIGKSCEALEQRIRPESLEVEEKELKPEYHLNSGQTEVVQEKNSW